MNETFERNISALEAKHPRLVNILKEVDVPLDRRWFLNERNVPVLQYNQQGRWNYLTSAYDPFAEAERQVAREDIDADTRLIFVLGEAGLYHVPAILDRASDNATVLLVSNKLAHLRVALEARDLTDIFADERFFVIADEDDIKIKATIHAFIGRDSYTLPTFSIVEHPVEARLQDEFFFEMKQFLHSAFTTALVNVNTTVFFEHWWTHNLLCNIPAMLRATPAIDMTGTWQGRPVIIVGAGPSLNKNIHLLNEAKGKALIICVDTAYRILQRHDIEPDLLVTLDGSPMNAAHMKDCEFAHVPLLFDIYSHHDILERHEGPKLSLSSVESQRTWWELVSEREVRPFGLMHGGSVATAAFSFAYLIGADPIVVIGNDLSYPNGQCYAAGALHETRQVSESGRRLFPVKDIFGQDTYTTFDYMFYLKWFQEQAGAKPDRTYINATEGGALKENFIIQTLADVLDEYCSEPLPVPYWIERIDKRIVPSKELDTIRRNLFRSKVQVKALTRYLKSMLYSLEQYVTKLRERDFTDLNEPMERVKKATQKLSRLFLALSFMDSHSFESVYRDIHLTETVQREREDYTKVERTIIAAEQSIKLYSDLYRIAVQSVDMHRDGIAVFEEAFHKSQEVE